MLKRTLIFCLFTGIVAAGCENDEDDDETEGSGGTAGHGGNHGGGYERGWQRPCGVAP
jgi:hypothetical protein